MRDLILTFSLEDGTINLNQGIIEALGEPKQVQLRIDEQNCQLMLRACDLHEEQAVVVQKEEVPQVGGRRLLKKIRTLAGWEDEEPRFVYGIYLQDYNAVVFDLRDARPLAEIENE